MLWDVKFCDPSWELQDGWDTYLLFKFNVVNFMWKTNEVEAGSIILLFFLSFECPSIVSEWGLVEQKVSLGASLNLGAWGKYLATHASLATTRLLIIRGSPIHPVDAFIPLLPMLLKEIRMFGQSKVLSFCFWCWSRECGGGVNPRFCNATTGVESYSQDLPHARWRTFVGVCRRLNQKCLIFILLGLDWSSG